MADLLGDENLRHLPFPIDDGDNLIQWSGLTKRILRTVRGPGPKAMRGVEAPLNDKRPGDGLSFDLVTFLNADPRETFVVECNATRPQAFNITFSNKAFDDSEGLEDLLDQADSRDDVRRFRAWCLAILHFQRTYEFAGRSWTAFMVSGRWKAVQAYDVIRFGTPSQLRPETETSTPATPDLAVPQERPRALVAAGHLLNQRVETLDLIMEMSDIGIFEYNAEGLLIRANDSWYRYSGHPRSLEKHQIFSFMDLVYHEDADIVMEKWNLLTQGRSVIFEMRWKAAEGERGKSQKLVDGVQWVLACCLPVFDKDGKLVSICGNTVDITSQKKGQREVKREAVTLERLRVSEYRFARFAELSPVAIYYFGPDRKLQYCNKQFFEVTGHPEVPFDQVDWERIIYPEDLQYVEKQWQSLMELKQPTDAQFRFKKLFTAPDGTRTQVTGHSLTYPEFDADGAINCVAGTVSDVSHFKWVENLQRVRAEEALEAKRQQENFIDMTSHEMRNPLSAVIQCSDSCMDSLQVLSRICEAYLASEPGVSAQARAEILSCTDALQTITSCSMHQKRIIDDVLALSKLDSNLILITPILVQPISVVADAIRMFDIECAKADISLSMQADSSMVDYNADWVMLDPSRLLQILINLLTNAIKFTRDRDTRSINIELGASSVRPPPAWKEMTFAASNIVPNEALLDQPDWGTGERLYLWFRVTDTGCGISAAEQSTLFTRFQQSSRKTHVQYGGSGLGLFVSKSLTELQCGSIGVHSVPNVGSTFAFFIGAKRASPRRAASRSALDTPTRHSRLRKHSAASATKTVATTDNSENGHGGPVLIRNLSDNSRSSFNLDAVNAQLVNPSDIFRDARLRVLIVEDNLVNQKVLAQQLRRAGCEVEVAGHGIAALEYMRTTNLYVVPFESSASPPVEETVLSPRELNDNRAGSPKAISPTPSTPTLDVILMDIEMPIMDGLSCAAEIRRLEATGEFKGHTPILAVSANARIEQIKQAIDIGMDGAIAKPFRIVEIIPKILEVVELADKGVSRSDSDLFSSAAEVLDGVSG